MQIGEIVDERYRITGGLGRGGMGTVYRAEHVSIRRPVALKLLNRELRNHPEVNERLEREAFATGRLTHPNCVVISDSGRLGDGSVFLVTELLEGTSLADVLDREGRLDVRRALHITRHTLRGLGHAHGEGVVHRDMKPDNIFLTDTDGDPDFVKLLDFGIAKLVGEAMAQEGGKQITQAGLTIGTPEYMAPEQIGGEGIDPRTDLYAVSVVLYEMLAGRPPFVGEPMQVVRLHLTEVPPRIEGIEAGVPDAVERMIHDGMAKAPDNRIQSAGEYLARVEKCWSALENPATTSGPAPARDPAAVTSTPASNPIAVTPQPVALHEPAPPLQTSAPGAVQRPAWRSKHAIIAAIAALALVFVIAFVAGPNDEERFKIGVYDLEHGASCEERLAAIGDLEELGDKRAIAALEAARARRCTRERAEEAIRHLEASQ